MNPVVLGNGLIRLYNGDCTEILPYLSYDSVVTDPPFGMAFVSNYRKIKYAPIKNDEDDKLLRWVTYMEVKHSKYVFCRWDNLSRVKKPKSLITWVKNNWSMGDLKHEHARQTESILFYPGRDHFFPDSRPKDVVFAKRTQNKLHPTQKPVELMQTLVKWTSGVVLDPFMGSGSTGIAAYNCYREFIGIELDKQHFDTAVRRITSHVEQIDCLF